ALGEAEYTGRAATAARFLLEHLRTDDGRLLHRYRNGTAGIPATLDDYAFLTWGLIELYAATHEPRWLREALVLHRTMRRHFWDEERGGYSLTPDDGEALLVRQKEYYDGAVPSGNSVAMLNALRLGRLTGDAALEEEAERIGRSSAEVAQHPMAHTMMMTAAQMGAGPAQEVTVTGEPDAADTAALLDVLRERYLPSTVVHLRPPDGGEIAALAPYTAEQAMRDGRATAYVCERFACQQPTTDPAEMRRQLAAGRNA
ncbi:MAG: thioredoxin domain-containing protein, partial [Rhodothermales bacterium]|nr:thioredoxin domain-containing protein [Rhodothermales bacterium]